MVLEQAERLAPGFLVAMPQLRDPNFRRTVILLSSHGADGAMGFVVNRPLPATVKEVLEGLDIPWNGNPEAPVWGGGPVMPQTGWVLFEHPSGSLALDAQEVVPGLYVSASVGTLRTLARRPPRCFRLILGYSGWGARQVESELLEGLWLVSPVDRRLIFDTPPEEAWAEAFRHLGIEPGTIVPSQGIQ